MSRGNLYVIAGKDCNKHAPKIFNVFKHYKQCIEYLNDKGRGLDRNFDITKFKCDVDEHDPCYASFEHKELFKILYNRFFCNVCMHKGGIHIIKIDDDYEFDDVYDILDAIYV